MQTCIREVHSRQKEFEKSQQAFLKASARVDELDMRLQKFPSLLAPDADAGLEASKPHTELYWDGDDDDTSSNISW